MSRERNLRKHYAQPKLKQVRHLCGFIEPLLTEMEAKGLDLTVADHGAGKSYLGFLLYNLFFKPRPTGHVYAIETRGELVEQSRRLAARLGFERMEFVNASVADSLDLAALPERIGMITALHACDTATDDAIAFGLRKQAHFMVLAPCCQAEVARLLNADKASAMSRSPLSELWRRPLHTREFGSQITNVLRCLYLEAQGYAVTVTELVGWEHSLKNELIVARKAGAGRAASADRLRSLLGELGLSALLQTRFRLGLN